MIAKLHMLYFSRFKTCVVALLVALSALCVSARDGSAQNVTNDFASIIVSKPPPKSGSWQDYSSIIQKSTSPDVFTQAIKQALQEYLTAQMLPPKLEPSVAGKAGIFVVKASGQVTIDDGEFFTARCSLASRDFIVLSEEVGNDARAISPDETKAIVAKHELFHAVQYEHPWTKTGKDGRQCSEPSDWITEGTADAAAMFLHEKANGKPARPAKLFVDYQNIVGLRPYFVSLHENTSNWNECYTETDVCSHNFNTYPDLKDYLNYNVSAFWRHMMERIMGAGSKEYSLKRLEALTLLMNHQPPTKAELTLDSNPLSAEGIASANAFSRHDVWLDWVAAFVTQYHGDFHYAFSEFVTEFASWPVSKYSADSENWHRVAFGGCHKQELSPTTQTRSFEIKKVEGKPSNLLYPVAARCFEVTLSGFPNEVELSIEVHTQNEGQADQLNLGMAFEETPVFQGGGSLDTCYDAAKGAKRAEFKCLYFGKVGKWQGEQKTKTAKFWRFEPRQLDGGSLRQVFVLANVKPGKPSETETIEDATVHFTVKSITKSGKTGFRVPSGLETGSIPDLKTPKRDLLYGIGNGGALSGIYPMNMAPLSFVRDDTRKGSLEPRTIALQSVQKINFEQQLREPQDEKEADFKYTLLPVEIIDFGQIGEFHAVIERRSTNESDPPVLNMLCAGADDNKALTITRSDDAALHMRIKTPLCSSKKGDFMDCINGCPVFETLDIEVSLGGGWRYFAANKPRDIITPSVRHDIDRYHQTVFGEPVHLTPLPDLKTVPENGFPTVAPTIRTTVQDDASACDCSCKSLEEIEELQGNALAMLKPGTLTKLQCISECMSEFTLCKQ